MGDQADRGPGPPEYDGQNFVNLEGKLAEQQQKITELKEKIRQSEADKFEKVSSAKLKADQCFQKLTNLRSGKKNKSDNKHKDNKSKQLKPEEKQQENLNVESKITDTPKKSTYSEMKEMDQENIALVETTIDKTENLTPTSKTDSRTPRSEKIMLLKKQTEENKRKIAERLKNQKGIEVKVSKLKEQIDNVQIMFTPEKLAEGENKSFVEIESTATETCDLLNKIHSLENIIINLNEKLKENSSKPESITDLLLSDMSYIDVQNELNLDDKKMLQYMQNLVNVRESEKESLQIEILDLKENLKEKDCVIDSKTKAITLMSESLSLKGRNTLDLLEETKLEMSKMQSQFVAVETELKNEIQRLLKENEIKSDQIMNLSEANSILEQSRYELTVKNAELENLLSNNDIVTDLNTKINELKEVNEDLLLKISELETQRYEIITHEEVESAKLISDTSLDAEKINIEEIKSKLEELQNINNDLKQSNIELHKTIDLLDSKNAETEVPQKVEQKQTKNTSKGKGKGKNQRQSSLPRQKSDLARTDSFEKKINELESELSECKNYIVVKDEENRKLINEIETLSLDVNDKVQEIKLLQDNLDVMEKKHNIILNDLESAKSQPEKNETDTEVQKLEKLLDDLKVSSKQEIEALQKEIDSYSNLVISDANEEVLVLNNKISELIQKIAELEEEKGNLQLHLVDYDTNKVPDGDLNKRLFELQITCQSQIQSIELLESQKFDIVQDLHLAKQQIASLEDQLADLSQYEDAVSSQITTIQLEERIEMLSKNNNELLTQNNLYHTTNQCLQSENEMLKEETDNLTQKIEECLCENVELIKKIDRMEKLNAEKVSSAESIEIVDNLTHKEKMEIEEYNKQLQYGREMKLTEEDIGGKEEISNLTFSKEKIMQIDDVVSAPSEESEETDLNTSVAKLTEESAELMKKIELFTQERREVMERMDLLTMENQNLITRIEELEESSSKQNEDFNVLNEEKNKLLKQLEIYNTEREEQLKNIISLSEESIKLKDNINLLVQERKITTEEIVLSETMEIEEVYEPPSYKPTNMPKEMMMSIEESVLEAARCSGDSNNIIKEYIHEIDKLKSDIEFMTKEAAATEDLLSKNKDLEKMCEDMKKEIEKLSTENVTLKKKFMKLKEQYKQSKTNKKESKQSQSEIETSTAADDDNVNYKLQSEKLIQEVEYFKLQVQELEEVKTEMIRVTEERGSLQESNEELSKKISILNAQVLELSNENKHLQENYEKSIEKFETYQRNTFEKECEFKNIKYNYETLLTETNERSKSEINMLNDQIKQLSAQVSDKNSEHLEIEIGELTLELKENRLICDKYCEEVKQKDESISILNNQITDLYKNMEQLSESCQIKEDEMNTLLKQGEENNYVVSKLKEDLIVKDNKIDELCLELKEKQSEIENTKTNLPKIEDISKPYEIRISELEESYMALEIKTKEQFEKMKKLAANLKKKVGLCTEFEKKLAESQIKITEYETQLQILKHENSKISTEVQKSNEEQIQMQSSISEEINLLKTDLDKLNKELDAKTFELSQLYISIENKNSTIMSFTNQVEDLSIKNYELLNQIKHLEENNINNLNKIAHHENLIQDLTQIKNNYEHQLQKLTTELQQSENKKDILVEISNLEGIIKQKEETINQLMERINEHKNNYETSLDGIKAKLVEKEAYIESIEVENNNNKEKIAKLIDGIASIEERRYSLERKAEVLDAQLNEKTEVCSEFVHTEDILVKRLNALVDQDEILERKVSDLSKDNEELNEKIRRLQDKNEEYYKQLKVYEDKIRDVDLKEHFYRDVENENNQLQMQITILQNDLKKIQMDYDQNISSKHKEIEDMETELSTQLQLVENERKILVENLEKSKDANDELKDEIVRLKDCLHTLEQNKSDLERDNTWISLQNDNLLACSSEIETLKEQVSNYEEEIRNLNSQLQSLPSKATNDEILMQDNSFIDVEKLQIENNNLKGVLAEKNVEIENYQRRNMQLQMAASFGSHGDSFFTETGANTNVSASANEINSIKAELSSKNQEIQQLLSNIDMLNQHIVIQQNEYKTLNEQCSNLQSMNDQKDTSIADLVQKVQYYETSLLQNLQENLSQISNQYLELQNLCTQKENKITELLTEISSKNEKNICDVENINLDLHEAKESVSKLDVKYQELENLCAEKDETIGELVNQVTSLKEKILSYSNSNIEIQNTEEKIQRLLKQNEELNKITLEKEAKINLLISELSAQKQQFLREQAKLEVETVMTLAEEKVNSLRSSPVKQARTISFDVEEPVQKLKAKPLNAAVREKIVPQLELRIEDLEEQLKTISEERDEALIKLKERYDHHKTTRESSEESSILLSSIEEQIMRQDDLVKQKDPTKKYSDVVDVSIPKEHPKEIVEEIIVPKSAYLCHDDEDHSELKASFGDQSWDADCWGAEDAILEEKHQQLQSSSSSVLEKKLKDTEEKLKVFELDRERLRDEITELKVKSGKLLKKCKEYKAKNDSLTENLKFKNQSLPNELDFAIQEELTLQIDNLEKQLKEMKNDIVKEKSEKDGLNKRIDVLSAANDRMIENKERQDLEIERLNIKIKQMNSQFEWGVETSDNQKKPVDRIEQKSDILISDRNLQHEIEQLNATINELNIDNEELQSLLEEQKVQHGEMSKKLATIPDLNNFVSIDEHNRECMLLKDDVNNTRAKMEEIKLMYDTKHVEYDLLQGVLDGLHNKFEVVSSNFNKSENLVKSLQKEISILIEERERKITNNADANNELQSKLEDLKVSVKNLTEELNVKTKELISVIEERNSLRKSYEDENIKVENLLQNIHQLDCQIKEYSTQLAALAEERNRLNEENSVLLRQSEDVTRLTNDNNILQLELVERESTIASLSTQIKQHSDKIMILTEECEGLQKELQQLRSVEQPAGQTVVQQITSQIESLSEELLHPAESVKAPLISESTNLNNTSTIFDRDSLLKEMDVKTNENKTLNEEIKKVQLELLEVKSNLQTTINQLNEHWTILVDQRGNEIAESWKMHVENREKEFAQIEQLLKLEITNLQQTQNVQQHDVEKKQFADHFGNEKSETEILNLQQLLQYKELEIIKVMKKLEEMKLQTDEFVIQIEALQMENNMLKSDSNQISSKYEEIKKIADKLKTEYDEIISENELKYKENLSEKENKISSLTTELNEVQVQLQQYINNSQNEAEFRVSLQQKESIILQLKEAMELKEIELKQETEKCSLLINQKYEEITLLEQKILDINAHYERFNSERQIEINNYTQQCEEALRFKDDEIVKLCLQVETKSAENNELTSKIEELNLMLEEENKQLLQLRQILETQEFEIVTLKENLEYRTSEYRKLAGQLDPFPSEGAEELPVSAEVSTSSIEPTKYSESAGSSTKSELDLALYMLHQRDVRCEELTLELMRLLEERDTLQLRLSNAIRINEDIRSSRKDSEAGSQDIREEVFEASTSTSEMQGDMTQDPNTSVKKIVSKPRKKKTSSEEADTLRNKEHQQSVLNLYKSERDIKANEQGGLKTICNTHQIRTQKNALSELHSLDQSRDLRIADERSARFHQMNMVQKDLQNLPQEAKDKLVGADYTLSRDSQSASTVLLNWIWGKSTPKVEHL